MRLGQIPPFSHCPTWLQASINQQKKEATWALLQMWQRRPLGPLMPKAKAPSRSMSQLWHKGTLEGWLPKTPSMDLDIPSWSWARVLWPSSTQPPQICCWRCPGLQALILITSMEPRVTLTVAGKPISFLIDTGATYFAMPAYSKKKQSLLDLCFVGWCFNIYTTNNQASTLHTSRYPIFSFFSHTPKMPHSYSWKRLSLKI